MSTSNQKSLIENFIIDIWNHERFEKIDHYLDAGFIDHSLPPSFEMNQDGLIAWVKTTSRSFEHKSIVEEHVHENDTCIVKFRMDLRHIGLWRGLEPTLKEISIVGYRCFKITNGKISNHWALIDGNSIENQLKECAHGCKIQQ